MGTDEKYNLHPHPPPRSRSTLASVVLHALALSSAIAALTLSSLVLRGSSSEDLKGIYLFSVKPNGLDHGYIPEMETNSSMVDDRLGTTFAQKLGYPDEIRFGMMGKCNIRVVSSKLGGGTTPLCSSSGHPFHDSWEDIVQDVVVRRTRYNSTPLPTVTVPQKIQDYTNKLARFQRALHVLGVFTVVLLAWQIFVGAAVMVLKTLSLAVITAATSILGFAVCLTVGATATGVYSHYASLFKDGEEQYMPAGLGGSGIAMLWVSTALTVICGAVWVWTVIKYRQMSAY